MRAFDPTLSDEEIAANGLRDGVEFSSLGLGHANDNIEVYVNHRSENMTVPVKTLMDIKRMFGEEEERITYLKGSSRYDVRIGRGRGSLKSGRSKGGCMNFIV